MIKEQAQTIYHNAPQLKAQLVDTQIMVCRWGRATGKTSLGGWWTADRMNRMPRSGGAIAGTTYTHLLTKLAPGIIKAWQALGYKEGLHFWYGKYPPKNFRIPNGYQPMLSPKYCVFWWNGAYTQFLSADRGLSNALNADFIYFDEARFLAYEKVREISMTVRGNMAHFGHLSCHGSLLFTTDAPRSAKSQWINNMEKEQDPKVIEVIMMASIKLNHLKLEMMNSGSVKARAKIGQQIAYYENWLNEMRRGQVYFSKASTFENVHAIGIQAIKNFKKILSPQDFRISVLNLDSSAPPNSFYPLLNEEVHGFHSENVAYIESLPFEMKEGISKDCLWKDPRHYDRNGELDIAMDYNNAINSLVVGQGDQREYRLLNSMFVLGENREFLADVVAKFCNFYKQHKNKAVNYYYDHTAISGNAVGAANFKDEVVDALRKAGWQVREHRLWLASKHEEKFEFWLKLLGDADPRLPKLRFDLDDCEQWRISAQGAGVKQVEKGFKKDKSTEHRKDRDGNYAVRPEDSTHLSDAADTLLDGKFARALRGSTIFIE